MLLEEDICYDQFDSWQNSVNLCSVSFCTARLNLPVTSAVPRLPTFALQSPMMERTFFFFCISGGSEVKVSASNAGDPSLIPGLGRSPGEGNGNPLQYSCLENPMNGEA